LQAGELDWVDGMDPDLVPLVERSANARMLIRKPVGLFQIMRLNHLHPPFDNPAIRRAVLLGINQKDYAQATMGSDPRLFSECRSFFTCGTPFESDVGTAPLRVQSVEKAAAALKQAGYSGEKIVILQATDLPNNRAVASVTADLFTRMGMNVELAASDWATVGARRMRKEPGAWNVYFGASAGTDLIDPVVNANLRTNGIAGLYGWPDDPRIEALRDRWLGTVDTGVERQLAEQIQTFAFETVPYVPLFRLFRPSGVAKSLKGILRSPAVSFWNVEKA
jgi:peptide/nickel transport system substrate-binding protein